MTLYRWTRRLSGLTDWVKEERSLGDLARARSPRAGLGRGLAGTGRTLPV
jgi:hypothetical protein